ncbi:Zn-ribbon domain-containing OB-fold protein, partial [Streptomyces sp. MB09-02B]|uniref:Zn-ribbon domain-containing OB-fold protein n=1 Tax=Streptomyces sp. MB09-02B TaxID=3028667 RepID=UPI0029A050CC
EQTRRPRPVVNRDNSGFWEGISRHRLLIQRCADCATLRLPWLPGCNACGSAAWDTVEASGEGVVYSYVVMHHPPFPAFDPPYAVGLIELAEGVRTVSNVVGVPCDEVRIGMPVRLEFVRCDEELELPVFRACPAGAEEGAASYKHLPLRTKTLWKSPWAPVSKKKKVTSTIHTELARRTHINTTKENN